ncbi:MAG: hypothetical protein ACI4WS_13850, partial [Oscillospiraceae bacterium]
MELENNKHYLVYNYSSSPVTVATRYDSYIIQGGTKDEPTTFPMTLDEIMYINNTSGVFKYGLLWFNEAYAKDIYEYLRIRDYDKIMTDEQIEDCLTNPTAEKMDTLVKVTSDVLFNRIRGIYMRIKNTTGLSSKVSDVIERRYREIRDKKFTSAIEIQNASASRDNEINALRKQIEELTKLVSASGMTNAVQTEPVAEPVHPDAKIEEAKKPASSDAKTAESEKSVQRKAKSSTKNKAAT